jgi:hypothetical protein
MADVNSKLPNKTDMLICMTIKNSCYSKFFQRKLLVKIEVSWDVTLCCRVPGVLKDHGAFSLTASGTSHPTRTRISSNTIVGTSNQNYSTPKSQ